MQLNPKALGLAGGILPAAFWLAAMIISLLTGIGETSLTAWGNLHPFFSYSWPGMIIMVIEHLVFGFIAGWLFAKIYNKFI
jgi:hypothetical protein